MSNNQRPRTFKYDELVRMVTAARDLAAELKHEYVTTEHVLSAIVEEPSILDLFKSFKIDPENIKEDLNTIFATDAFPEAFGDEEPRETETLGELVRMTAASVMFSGRNAVQGTDLLLPLLQLPDSMARDCLESHGLTELNVKQYLTNGAQQPGGKVQPPMVTGPDGEQRVKDITSAEEAQTFLEKFTTNLNEQAAEGLIDNVIGRETEIEDLVQVIARRRKNNAVLVGEPGVGKTAIAEGLALKIHRKEVPEIIQNATVYGLNIGDLVAGTRFRGDFEERMKFILKALTFMENPILFIDEIHMIMGAGSGKEGAMDVANLLKPALAKGTLKCIGSTTFDEYRKHFEKDKAMVRRFEKLDINEPDNASAKLIMRGLREHYEKHHGVTYTDAALDAAVDLTTKYVQSKFLPDKAIDILDIAGARQRVRPADTKELIIDVPHIEYAVAKVAKMPATTVQSDERAKLVELEVDLKKAVFGQDDAIQAVVDSVLIARAGLRDADKPAGAFLFMGPTGVGKTETAKQLAATLGVPMVRFDMSEYSEKHTVAKLIGAPPGYVGHGEGGAGSGLLTNEIETKPHCVLLLDEVEKAHPEIFNTFLQVFDAGQLTNSNGKTVYFNNVTIIMTSNVGAREAAKNTLGFNGPATRTGADEVELKKFFSPEFLNRLSAVVKFKALGKDLLIHVVNKFMSKISSNLAEREIKLVVSEAATNWLASKDVDPAMGARPVERVVDEHVKKPLSRAILFQGATKGSTITVDVVENKITVAVA